MKVIRRRLDDEYQNSNDILVTIICANSGQRVYGHVWVCHYVYMFVLYFIYVTHMGQSIFVANIFRGGSLSSLTYINVTKWAKVF